MLVRKVKNIFIYTLWIILVPITIIPTGVFSQTISAYVVICFPSVIPIVW